MTPAGPPGPRNSSLAGYSTRKFRPLVKLSTASSTTNSSFRQIMRNKLSYINQTSDRLKANRRKKLNTSNNYSFNVKT